MHVQPGIDRVIAERPIAFAGLRPVALSDRARFEAATVAAGLSSAFLYFPYLYFSGQRQDRAFLHETIDDALAVYVARKRKGRADLELLFPPFPFTPQALRHAAERVRDTNRQRGVRIRYVEEALLADVAPEGCAFRLVGEEFVYDSAAVQRQDGADFRRLRRQLARTARYSDLVLRRYRASDHAACQRLLDGWRSRMEASGIRADGYRYRTRCLEQAGAMPGDLMAGDVVEIDGAVAGFILGGPIRPELGCLLIAHSRPDLQGIPYLLRVHHMARWGGLAAFNDGTDAKRPGLRALKSAFRPIRMNALFSASMR